MVKRKKESRSPGGTPVTGVRMRRGREAWRTAIERRFSPLSEEMRWESRGQRASMPNNVDPSRRERPRGREREMGARR